jgi:hypothetical protein
MLGGSTFGAISVGFNVNGTNGERSLKSESLIKKIKLITF